MLILVCFALLAVTLLVSSLVECLLFERKAAKLSYLLDQESKAWSVWMLGEPWLEVTL